MSNKGYVLGSAPQELQRLILQDRLILRPITERLLSQAGPKEGMRVLDLGCGTGGVSVLAAEMVGPYGAVVGTDQSVDAIAMAKESSRESGFQQSAFCVSSVEAFSSPDPFDIVSGRYVLMYQPSPAAFIRAASRHVLYCMVSSSSLRSSFVAGLTSNYLVGIPGLASSISAI